jgi:hypothetical protein
VRHAEAQRRLQSCALDQALSPPVPCNEDSARVDEPDWAAFVLAVDELEPGASDELAATTIPEENDPIEGPELVSEPGALYLHGRAGNSVKSIERRVGERSWENEVEVATHEREHSSSRRTVSVGRVDEAA